MAQIHISSLMNQYQKDDATEKNFTDLYSRLPATFIADASVAGSTLTLTKSDGTTVTFTDTQVTSINGLSGGSLTSPLVIKGGDGAGVAKIALDHTQSGQITDESTHTLFGFTTNGTTTLTIGHSSYAMALRGSATRPTYNGNNLALYSDIPAVNNGTLTIQKNGTTVATFTANQSGNATANIAVPTKTSDLNNDSGFITSSAIHDGTLTIQQNGTTKGTFTANQSGNTTADIDTHHPNLLINSNFKINQRGASSYYNGGSYKYTVDRWIKRDNADTIEILTKGVRFKSGSGSVHFLSQTVEPELYQNLLGTTVTLSIKVNAVSLSGSAKLDIFMGNGNYAYANGGYEWGKLGITTTGTFSTNINIPSSITNSYLNIILSLSNASSGNYVDIEWVKLEVGNVATTYSPPTYAEEIIKCFRYYLKINNLTSAPYYPVGQVWGTGSDNRLLVYEKMRANPAITMSGAYIIYGNNGSYYSVSSMSFLERNTNAVLIKITGTNMPGGLHGTLMANNNASSYIEIDAEIY